MGIEIKEELFKELWPFILDENVTDIKWNGTSLWITDLSRGRYMVKDISLSEEWLRIFTNLIANSVNENFNISRPSLKAETRELRIQAVHGSVSEEGRICLAIRKTPSCARLLHQDLLKSGYADDFVLKLLPCLMRGHLSGVITGDVGAGKTELEKYLCSFIPDSDPIITVEDTLEMKLKTLYPEKDIYSLKISDAYSAEQAIRDALRLNTKWLIISESRGREILRIIEGASSGCVALTSIHTENVWEVPDRILNMAGDNTRNSLENDVFTFFDYAIKVKADYSNSGIRRSIDQICFFDRKDKQNSVTVIVRDGKPVKAMIPERIYSRFYENREREFMEAYSKFLRKKQRKENEGFD
ncbi:MAG: type II/IV secretion system ATPase subunit [Erysipelotrichaceae bacterium]|nr:type II/IV secretion system ATPase subunit [Erysipelotrichaceae bacterium]